MPQKDPFRSDRNLRSSGSCFGQESKEDSWLTITGTFPPFFISVDSKRVAAGIVGLAILKELGKKWGRGLGEDGTMEWKKSFTGEAN